jgi:hypothetical protein
MVEKDVHGSHSDIGKLTPGVREIRVFLCYRRQDGAWHADWLYRHLQDAPFLDASGKACHIRVYYDKTAPGVSDWKKLHFPSLQTSQAMILVCTPGIATDFSRRGQPDWVYEELRWWGGHRDTAPIVVDATGEGDRWLPRLITRKWPDINRIDLNRDDAAAAEGTDVDFAPRIRERIIGAIRESEQRTVFEDLQRFKRLNKRLTVALSCSVLLFFLAASASVVALRARDAAEEQRRFAEKQQGIAEEQTRIAEEQKRVVQTQVIKLLFLPSTQDSDEARDAFYTSLRGTASNSIIYNLMDRTIANKSNRHGVVNALKILECYGPHRDNIRKLLFDKLYSELESVEDGEIKLHLEMLRMAIEADQSGKPRPKIPGYNRCQWVKDINQQE